MAFYGSLLDDNLTLQWAPPAYSPPGLGREPPCISLSTPSSPRSQTGESLEAFRLLLAIGFCFDFLSLPTLPFTLFFFFPLPVVIGTAAIYRFTCTPWPGFSMGTSRKTALYQGSCAALFSIPPFGMDWGGELCLCFFFPFWFLLLSV